MDLERISRYLKIIVIIELLVSFVVWLTVTNLDPHWLQYLSFAYLPSLDLITIAIWLVCRGFRDRAAQSSI